MAVTGTTVAAVILICGQLKLALAREAKRQGQTPSALIRKALQEYLDTA